jgi:hypothetical protein
LSRLFRRDRVVASLPLALATGAILWHLRDFLPPHTLPRRGDPALPFRAGDLTPQWVPWLQVAIDALWRQGTVAFWDPFTNAGAPEFESPQAGVVSLTTLLGGALPLEAAVKYSILSHVVAGMFGTHLFARRLGVRYPFAALGALAFGLGTYLLDHVYVGHLDHIYAMGLTPWALLAVWTALDARDSWWRPACAAGIVLGIESLEGAASALLYSLLACSLVVVAGSGRGWLPWLRRVCGVGAVAGLCFAATAAPQLLPMQAYLASTGRGGGLTLAQSMVAVREVAHPMPTITAALALCVGLGTLWVRGQRRAAIWLASVMAFAIAAANLEAFYAFLWRYAPGIRYQRIPQRALMLVGVAAPVVIAAAADGLWTACARAKTVGAAIAVTAIGWFVYDAWSIAPGTPPMTDPRIEREHNHAMRWLAAHAEGSRVHIWEPPTRHWLADNITVPLGLEAINSYTPTEHQDYRPGDFAPADQRSFLGDGDSHPARFWGLLNVRFVVAESPQADPGFTLAAHVKPCPVAICQPAKAAGPYIYENRAWMPRAWMVRRAVALVGERRRVYEAVLDLLAMPAFDPARLVVLQLEQGDAVPQVDQVFGVDLELAGAIRWRTGRADDYIARMFEGPRAPIEPVSVRRVTTNRIDFTAPSDGWLVASEQLALYPGWTAAIKRTRVPLFRADGILTATRVRAGDIVRTFYEPPRFRLGLVMCALMVVAIVGYRAVSRRRNSDREPAPGARRDRSTSDTRQPLGRSR